MIYLKQSTASQEVLLGPFVDDTDGKTAETGLTIANTDIKLFKSGATTLANKNSGGATHISNGWYYAVLDATDTDTVGGLVIVVNMSGALPVKAEFMVVPANVYDSLVAGTDYLQADTVQVEGSDATDQINAEVVDALATDTYAEPGQEAPGATVSLKDKIGYIYKFLRNKIDNNGTEIKVYNDDGTTVGQKASVSESGGTVTRGEFGTGA